MAANNKITKSVEKNKIDPCPYVEIARDGSFKLSGPEKFVNPKYEKLNKSLQKRLQEIEDRKRELLRERCCIALILLVVFIVLLLFAWNLCDFPIKKHLLIFSFGILGSSFRAGLVGKDIKSDKTVKDLHIAYFLIYPIVLLAFSFLLLSVFTDLGYKGWTFYGTTLPIGFFAGIMALGILEKFEFKI